MGGQAGRQASRQADRQAGRQTSRQAGKQASRQAGRQANLFLVGLVVPLFIHSFNDSQPKSGRPSMFDQFLMLSLISRLRQDGVAVSVILIGAFHHSVIMVCLLVSKEQALRSRFPIYPFIVAWDRAVG